MRRSFTVVRTPAVRARFFSDETDRLEAKKKALGATNDALRKLLVKASPAAAAATDTCSVMKSTTETLAAIGTAAMSDAAATTLLKTRNALSDSNAKLREISSRLDQPSAVVRKETELRQVREDNDGLRKALADLDASESRKSFRAGKSTAPSAQPASSAPPPSSAPPRAPSTAAPPSGTARARPVVWINNMAPPPPGDPFAECWFDGEEEPLWFKYRVHLAATGGFLVGLFVGNLAFSGSQKPSKAEKARVAQLQREIDAEKVEQERLLKEIARKTKEKLNE